MASLKWKGFRRGKYLDPDIEVMTEYVGQWDDSENAVKLYEKMKKAGADVVYPAGDGYNVPVIEQIKKDGLYAIGYVSDQSELGRCVLTSTIQHVDDAYELTADEFNKGTLKGGKRSFDIQEGVIEMGKFSPVVDPSFQEEMKRLIDEIQKKQTNCQTNIEVIKVHEKSMEFLQIAMKYVPEAKERWRKRESNFRRKCLSRS